MEAVQLINHTNVINMNAMQIRLSGMYAELIVRGTTHKVYNRNSGRKSKVDKLTMNLSEEELQHQQDVRIHSIGNTLRNFKRLLYANFSNGFTFLTITFDANKCDFDLTDVATCRTKFTNFWKNLKRGTKTGEYLDDLVSLVYLGVIEFHKDGTIHLHILCHIPRKYEELLKKKWQHGHLDFKRKTQDPLSVRKIESYMKKGIHDPRLNNENHRYLASRGLKKPVIFKFISNGFPTWINEDNSELIYQEDSEYAFSYYQFITKLTEDEFQSFIESSDPNYLNYLIEQMEMIQQHLSPVA